MCGFAALFEPGRRFDPALLAAMDGDLHHRGPDSGATHNEAGLSLVFRRLAIIDPRPVSDQPMTDASGQLTLVFNGEIYNYRELRHLLEQQGAAFRTASDTEVLLEGYRHWGDTVLERLEGMFAFCLIDRTRGVALVARDPLGIKPLYMARRGRVVAFASEARPLHRLGSPEVDEAALAELITFGWAAGRLSNFRHIDRIPGGSAVTVSLDTGEIRERRYCDPLDTLRQKRRIPEQEVGEAVASSVKQHLASDVGYTVQLSGGVDSSLVAALAATHTSGQLATYSIGLGDHAYDESRFQDMVVRQYGLEHELITVGARDYADFLPKAVRHMEGPTPHGGCVMLMMLCARSRHRSKVILTGEGADEFFGGYLRYAIWRKTMWQERVARLLPSETWPDLWPFSGLRRLAGLDAVAYSTVYHDFRSVSDVFPDLVPRPGARESTSARFADFRDRLFAVDQAAYLESLLVRQDKMSMAQSVEARVPFVHMPLARVANSLPHDVRCPGGATKPVLKRIAESLLPKELIHRRKIGLWLPYHEWFADPRGAGQYVDALGDSQAHLSGYADKPKYRALIDSIRKGNRKSGMILQRLVELELWMRSLAEEPRPAVPAPMA